MSTIKVDTIQNTSGVEVYTGKAWIAVSTLGTAYILASGNVSSMVDNAAGDFTGNFSSALPTTLFGYQAGLATWGPSDPGGADVHLYSSGGSNGTNPLLNTSYLRAEIGLSNGANRDFGYASWSVII